MTPTTMITVSGREVDVLNPRPEDFCIEDIAHSLSQLCRFTGHTNRFYSVGEHCLNVSYLVDTSRTDPETAFWGLLHDVHEAFIGDISTPVKRAFGPMVTRIEAGIDAALFQWLGWTPTTVARSRVKFMDHAIVHYEWRALMPMPAPKGLGIIDVDEPKLLPMGSPYQVAQTFCGEFRRLRGQVLGKTTNVERPSNIRVRGATDPCIVDSVPAPLS